MFVYFNLYFALYLILTLCNISKVAPMTGVAKNRIRLSVMLESANKKNMCEHTNIITFSAPPKF